MRNGMSLCASSAPQPRNSEHVRDDETDVQRPEIRRGTTSRACHPDWIARPFGHATPPM